MSGGHARGDLVLLLRAVNLGARNKVPMARLRELLTAEGFTAVRTYLASGNVVVADDGTPVEEVATRVSALVLEHFGVTSPCVVRTGEELRRTVAAGEGPATPPLPADPRWYTVVFLDRVPDPALVATVAPDPGEDGERFAVVDRDVHVLTPAGTRTARLPANSFWERLSGGAATARNWRTVTALAAMAAAGPA